MITKKKLLEFCKKKGIFTPPNPTREYLEAAIVRVALHGKKIEGSCFGFWRHEDSNCMVCDFEEKCFTASIGTDKETYFKKLENAERIRLEKE